MSLDISKRAFNVDEYYRMAETGILTERDRVELIEGDIIEMNPIGSRHFACVNRLNTLLGSILGENAQISIQGPVRLDDHSQPEPDVAVLKPRDDYYGDGLPGPHDVLLLIEVADSSLDYDQQRKLPLYAKAGIAECWLVDLTNQVVAQYAQPADARYSMERRFARGENIVSGSVQNLTLAVDAILG